MAAMRVVRILLKTDPAVRRGGAHIRPETVSKKGDQTYQYLDEKINCTRINMGAVQGDNGHRTTYPQG